MKYIWVNLLVPIPTSFLYRITTKYGEYAVTGSEGAKMLVEKLRIPKEKVKVINLGVDLSQCTKTTQSEQIELKRKIGISDSERVILLYGRLERIKGHEFLLESLRMLNKTNYKVIFPGENNNDYKQYLMGIINDYNLSERVVFPGYINGREYLSISDLMVLPSIKDGWSFAFLESIAMGVPVIRTKTAGFEDIKDLCFGVDYGDVESLSTLIDDFLDDGEKFCTKAVYAKKESYRFSLDRLINDYYTLYCSILNNNYDN